ncbi:endonuclease/exonuclease/phosphatase family protein [Winogradskya humida]|uniref:Endonuclease/exonuclease/phosphatase domain-containing protein n=1 Tax=Winogradskya humida TaxID=113566 RepID=A0ABQ3ZKU4_9ACTN|nr:endonuclease/exonuclease/phosphatase family protein [Actinoplanes humidus]GIE18817.1 hypothetical protein Ahu01nite_019190 [Actinoplanes humidus]
MAVSLLTLNALMKGDVRARLRVLGGLLESSGYDVVCLQEVMYRSHAVLLRGLARSYGYRAWSGAVLLEGGLVVLSRLPVGSARFVRYPMSGPARPEFIMRKGAQVVQVTTADGPLAVINTHLSANRDGDWSPGARYTHVQRRELATLAAVVSGVDASLPVVVAGDLNVPRTAASLAGFLTAAGLRDTRADDTGPTYRPTPRWPSPPAFDHVLVRPGTVAETRLVLRDPVTLGDGWQAYLSDHYGVAAELTLP